MQEEIIHVIQSLPKLIEKATSRDLSKGLKDHLEETKNQIDRLSAASWRGQPCAVGQGLSTSLCLALIFSLQPKNGVQHVSERTAVAVGLQQLIE